MPERLNQAVYRAAVIALTFFLMGGRILAQSRPNIVLILADDLGIGDVSGYNPASKITTPNMDSLAKQGVRFTDAHSNSSVCTPTRYGILTGRYAWRTRLKTGVLDGHDKTLIEADRMTLASMLKQKGYATACVGKWHLGLDWVAPQNYAKGFKHGPRSNGFDYFFGIPASLDMDDYAYLENDTLVEAPSKSIAGSPNPAFWRAGQIAPGFKHIEVVPTVTEKALAWMRMQHYDSPATPIFLYLPLPSPHTPHVPMPAFVGSSQAGPRGDYVCETDWAIGRVLKTLDSLGLAPNTLVMVASDNGAHVTIKSAEKTHTPHMFYKGQKADIFEAGHRIPLIARWPGVIRGGRVSSQLVCLTDFMATTAAITGFPLPVSAGEDSYSFLPALLDKATTGNVREAIVHHSMHGTFAIRKGNMKLTLDNMGSGGFTAPAQVAGPGTLYDMDDNPQEDVAKNLYASKPEVVKELRDLLKEYRDTTANHNRSTPLVRNDEFYQAPTRIHGPTTAYGARNPRGGGAYPSWDVKGRAVRPRTPKGR
jgi:arylsulfatase A-like enzyme